jgi:hypothetical protein
VVLLTVGIDTCRCRYRDTMQFIAVGACVFLFFAAGAAVALYRAARIVSGVVFVVVLTTAAAIATSRLMDDGTSLALMSSVTHEVLHASTMQRMVNAPAAAAAAVPLTSTTTVAAAAFPSVVLDDDPLDEFPIASRRTFDLTAAGDNIGEQLADAVPSNMAANLAARAVSGGDGYVHGATYQMGGDVCVYHARWEAVRSISVVGTCVTIAKEVVGEERKQEMVLTGAVQRSCVAGSWLYCTEKAETVMRESVEPHWAPTVLSSSQQTRLLAALHGTLHPPPPDLRIADV